jgi:membrane-bound lytic murein transglycosylase B
MSRRRRVRPFRAFGAAGATVVLLVSGLLAAAGLPALAQSPEPPTSSPEGGGLLPGLDPRLVGVAVEYGTSARDVTALHDAQARLAALTQEQAALHQRQLELEQRLAFLDSAQQKAASDLVAAEENLRRLTTLVYTKGNSAWQTAALLQVDDALDASRVDKLGVSLTDQLVKAQERARVARKAASDLAAEVAVQRVEADSRLLQVERLELPNAQHEVRVLSVAAAATVAGASVTGLNIPLATLDAYLRAEATLGAERPQCALQWWMLAGIGRVESNHGRYGGAQPSLHGDVVPRIVGIPLDGSTPEVGTIADTDRGAFDGDVTWDHAVGPMQFIPSTWQRYQADGNGDGKADLNNVYDAALGAGRYLCAAAGSLSGDASLTRAYLAYNHSDDYAARVLDLARSYQSVGLPQPVA